MSLDQTANFVRATLASAIAAGDTTIALADSGQLVDPANGEYNLVVWNPATYPRPGQDPAVEIVRATALDAGANTLTVDRGQEGTSAADHPVEAVLQLSPTAKMFSDIDAKTSALSADGKTFAGDAIDVGSASADDARVNNELDAGGEVRGSAAQAGQVTFASEFVNEPFQTDTFDPEIVNRRHFDDGLYRVVVGESGANETQLYTTSDFNSFSLIASDILAGVSGSGQVAGIEVLNDGTFVLLSSTDTATDYYTGPDLQNLNSQGEFVPEPDGGTFHDRETGTLHYYPEDADTASGVSSQKLSHWEADDDALGSATQQADAVDVSGFAWKTGDPHIVEVGDWYYMFVDNTDNHPNYNIALAVGRTLDSFTVIDSNITPSRLGGDITLTRRHGYFEALTEYSDGANTIGHWRLWPHHHTQLSTDNRIRADTPGPEIWDRSQDEKRADWTRGAAGEVQRNFYAEPDAGGVAFNGDRYVDQNGNEVARVGIFNNNGTPQLLIQSQNLNGINLALPGTGQTELEVRDSAVNVPSGVTLGLSGSLSVGNSYSVSNNTTDRTFDADNLTVAELGDVVATLIRDLGVDTA